MFNWSDWLGSSSPSMPVVQWSLLLALAAAVGHILQRNIGLPKVLGYSIIGALAGFLGFTNAPWPLDGVGLFLVELGLSIVLFEAGGRLTLRWFRYNPMLLAQSLAESLATYLAILWVLQWLDVAPALRAPLALLAVASSPAVLMRVASDIRASGPVTDRAITLAGLNTLYVLALGGGMARFLGRPEASIIEAALPVIILLSLSILFGAALALALHTALRYMSPSSENTSVLLLALVAAATTWCAIFGGSAPLAALLAGSLLKSMHPRPWSWSRQFGTASSILTILMFVLVSMAAAQADWQLLSWNLIAVLVLTRALAKGLGIGLANLGSGASLKQSLWTASAMWPMSAVALLLLSQFVQYLPQLATQLAAIALPLILCMEMLGALMSTVALQRAGEAHLPVGLPVRASSEDASHGT
ncbi:MAG: cation:proton antiporter [Hylemonella sp.]